MLRWNLFASLCGGIQVWSSLLEIIVWSQVYSNSLSGSHPRWKIQNQRYLRGEDIANWLCIVLLLFFLASSTSLLFAVLLIQVKFREGSTAGFATLNNPKALNALNNNMVRFSYCTGSSPPSDYCTVNIYDKAVSQTSFIWGKAMLWVQVTLLYEKYKEWENNKNVHCIVLSGVGEKVGLLYMCMVCSCQNFPQVNWVECIRFSKKIVVWSL